MSKIMRAPEKFLIVLKKKKKSINKELGGKIQAK